MMKIDEYTAPPPAADYTPRPNASKEVARAKRARGESAPIAPAEGVARERRWAVAALFGGMLLFFAALSWQLSQPARPLALTPVPTVAAPTEGARLFTTSATSPPAPTSATIAPSHVIISAPPAGAVLAPPQTGRGLGAVATPAPPKPAPSYIENVGAQAPHCIRTCDGQPGPNGGDWALVPTAEPAMLEVIGRQTPHKVR